MDGNKIMKLFGLKRQGYELIKEELPGSVQALLNKVEDSVADRAKSIVYDFISEMNHMNFSRSENEDNPHKEKKTHKVTIEV